MRLVNLAEQAAHDLANILEWQTQYGSGPAALRRIDKIRRAIAALQNFPCRYPKGEHSGTRVLTVERHVIVSEIHPDTGRNETAGDVVVLRVFGPGQQRDGL